jgi:hypothetical protein
MFIGFIRRERDFLRYAERTLSELDEKTKATNENMLFITAGAALTYWAEMEEEIVKIVSHLLRTHEEKAGLIMYSIINFHVWRNLVSDLFEADEQLNIHKRRWNKLSERMRGIKDNRDQLAHHSARRGENSKEVQFRPSALDRRNKTKTQSPLSLTQTIDLSNTIQRITKDLAELNSAMIATLAASQDKSSAPNRDQDQN